MAVYGRRKDLIRKDVQDTRTNILGARGFFLRPAGCFGARCETGETAYGNFLMIHDDLLIIHDD